ncbi:MAG TPA: rhodanese-like domain-containing protein [Actinomycetota bacterium]|nr:rhodanese-like domain-containing protein [Actinomycetota bacterium]
MDASLYLVSRKAKVQVLDVRDPEEWDAGHLETAVNIPLVELEGRLDELDAGLPVLAVCRTGVRSAKAVDLLIANGFDAESIEGGTVALAEAGVTLVDAAGTPVSAEDGDDAQDPELAGLQDSMIAVVFAMQERFGDRDRTEAEEIEFMREYLAEKGKTPDEIAAIMSPEP